MCLSGNQKRFLELDVQIKEDNNFRFTKELPNRILRYFETAKFRKYLMVDTDMTFLRGRLINLLKTVRRHPSYIDGSFYFQ